MTMPNPFILPTIDFVGGTTTSLRFNTFSKDSSLPISLNGCEAQFSVSNFIHSGDSALVEKTMSISTDEQSGIGEVSVTIDSADTERLFGKYIYQIMISSSVGSQEVYQGILFIFRNINP